MFARYCCRAGTAVRCSSRSTNMPLRAKVLNPSFGGKAHMATETDVLDIESLNDTAYPRRERKRTPPPTPPPIKELPGDEKEDVIFNTLFGVRTIDLNRPAKLHSLNGSMIRKIVPRLWEWNKSDMANVVIIKGTGPKAFCAGGDVTTLAQDNMKGKKGSERSAEYFALEYKLNHMIATYQTPYVAFMDGITMGGGVGLSVHAPLRIATERTVFAMPETTIGFFPDVGASFFLPRMNGAVGTYLALTSERLKGVNAFYAGVATHYLHSTSLPALERRLAELRFKDYETLNERLDLIDATMEEFCTGLPHNEPMLIQGEIRKAIDRCFGKANVPDLIAALEAETGATKEWAEQTLASLRKRSPTSVYVTLRQMQLGAKWSIAETFQREHLIARHFMHGKEFTEGVNALLIRKDGKPAWNPASLEEVEKQIGLVDKFFDTEGQEKLKLLNDGDYREYPHTRFGIPSEAAIREVVREKPLTQREVIRAVVKGRNGKQGVKEVVQEVVSRKTIVEEGNAVWVDEP